MKLKVTSLVLGICLAVLASAANPAFARSTTAFSAFKVWEQGVGQFNDPLSCLTELYGAVVNNCTYPVNLWFSLPIDRPGTKTIDVQNFWGGTSGSGTFTCTSYAYAGNGPTVVDGTSINFTGPGETGASAVVVKKGSSITLVCTDVQPNGGVANINWTP